MSEITIVDGPPGTGKTELLLSILEKELLNVAPHKIAYASFTKEGSENGKIRAIRKFGLADADFPYARTLHSAAFGALKMRRDCVMSKYHYARFSKRMGMQFTGYYTEDLTNNDDKYLFYEALIRNAPSMSDIYSDELDMDKFEHVRKNYIGYKKQNGLYDFTDMIELFIGEDKALPVTVAFIDEAQDLTPLLWQMVWRAFRNCDRIYIAGDDDQAIYQWSGADVEQYINLEGNRKSLKTSYRVPEEIRKFAVKISDRISNRRTKPYEGTRLNAPVRFENTVESLRINPNESYMFLSRNTYFLSSIKTWIEKEGFLYMYKGKPSIPKSEIDAINTYQAISKGSIGTGDLYKVRSFLKDKYTITDPWYKSFNMDEEHSTYIRTAIAKRHPCKAEKIRIGTIHSVKGGEADNVVLLTDLTKASFNNLQKNPDAEHRVFYVAATRAKKSLTIIHSSSKYEYPLGGL